MIWARISKQQGRIAGSREWERKARESPDAFPGTPYELVRFMVHFQPVIDGVVAACHGDEQAGVERVFEPMKRDGWHVENAAERIWAGERDPASLTANIDYNSRAIVLMILLRLREQVPPVIIQVDRMLQRQGDQPVPTLPLICAPR